MIAWGTAKDDREEAQAARFADRIKELSGQMLDLGNQYYRQSEDAMRIALAHKQAPRMPDYKETRIGAIASELCLVVRLPASLRPWINWRQHCG